MCTLREEMAVQRGTGQTKWAMLTHSIPLLSWTSLRIPSIQRLPFQNLSPGFHHPLITEKIPWHILLGGFKSTTVLPVYFHCNQ